MDFAYSYSNHPGGYGHSIDMEVREARVCIVCGTMNFLPVIDMGILYRIYGSRKSELYDDCQATSLPKVAYSNPQVHEEQGTT